jgi:hypothetical protein
LLAGQQVVGGAVCLHHPLSNPLAGQQVAQDWDFLGLKRVSDNYVLLLFSTLQEPKIGPKIFKERWLL